MEIAHQVGPPGWMGDHGAWRPEWTSSRPRLLWYLTFEDRPQVAEGFRHTTAALRRAGCVDVVPDRWLHLTLAHIGFADEVEEPRLDEAAAAVADVTRATPPLRLTTGRVRTLSDAVVVAAGPVDELRRLQLEIRRATASAGIPGDPEDAHFWPHISLCYAHSRSDERRVAEAVARTPPSPCQAVADRLTQAAVTRADGHYRWEARAQLPFAGAIGRVRREHHVALHG